MVNKNPILPRFYKKILFTYADKVQDAIINIIGDALNWRELLLRDYLEHEPKDLDDKIKQIFGNYNCFEDKLKNAFKDPDEKRTAEQELIKLQ